MLDVKGWIFRKQVLVEWRLSFPCSFRSGPRTKSSKEMAPCCAMANHNPNRKEKLSLRCNYFIFLEGFFYLFVSIQVWHRTCLGWILGLFQASSCSWILNLRSSQLHSSSVKLELQYYAPGLFKAKQDKSSFLKFDESFQMNITWFTEFRPPCSGVYAPDGAQQPSVYLV